MKTNNQTQHFKNMKVLNPLFATILGAGLACAECNTPMTLIGGYQEAQMGTKDRPQNDNTERNEANLIWKARTHEREIEAFEARQSKKQWLIRWKELGKVCEISNSRNAYED
ncbi:MAG TPA: hypothetical protein VH595_14610 [Verrucomicrobiae bacterium]|nr:hypothetical protein [Verrucomicrobiae bacterium]